MSALERLRALADGASTGADLTVEVHRHRTRYRIGPVRWSVPGYLISVEGPVGRTAIGRRTARSCADVLQGLAMGAFYRGR